MSRISKIFTQLKPTEKAFIPFITAGDGGLENTFELMQVLVENGADIIELGIPFSDPMADGPIISRSHERSIMAGTNISDVFAVVTKFRQKNTATAVVLMGYLNPIEAFGYQQFADKAKECGVDGVLIIDMPPEEAHDLKDCLIDKNIDLIFLVAPTTTNKRLAFLAGVASGFIYFVSLKGITGAGHIDTEVVNANMKRIREHISLPVGVGFGIKDASTAKMVTRFADGAIVGSSFVSFIEQYADDKDKMLTSIGILANEISTAIK